jgi:UDP-N-acetylmuramoyl-tripeptide--D-alanyl-D-alanine ligase
MLKPLLSLYSLSYPKTLIYMLQSTEYQLGPYYKWIIRTKDFSKVTYRRELVKTKAARLLLLSARLGILIEILAGLLLVYLGIKSVVVGGIFFGIALILIYPFVWAYLITLPLILGRYLVSQPLTQKQVSSASEIFRKHKGVKIAVVGSYGKTSMKELLLQVLSEKLNVEATPANKNVSASHAIFAKSLSGKEDVLVIEYGEGRPGDVMNFAKLTHPNQAVITGLAPAHLDKYKTLAAAGSDIFSVADYLEDKNVFVYKDHSTVDFLKPAFNVFDKSGASGWSVANVKVKISGTSFEMTKGNQRIELSSGLVGRHQVAYLAFVVAYALQLGLSKDEVKAGIAKTKPFEHRMQPYQLNGAWVIDDTYNGNLEGIRAGTELLKSLKAERKIYVTPGLVDQGSENQSVHETLGELIAGSNPDLVVLMKNSVTEYIQTGLKNAKFNGKIEVKSDPLDFYLNLKHIVASGDLVLMQNDWPDNYA